MADFALAVPLRANLTPRHVVQYVVERCLPLVPLRAAPTQLFLRINILMLQTLPSTACRDLLHVTPTVTVAHQAANSAPTTSKFHTRKRCIPSMAKGPLPTQARPDIIVRRRKICANTSARDTPGMLDIKCYVACATPTALVPDIF